MNSTRRIAVTAGALFVVATGSAITAPIVFPVGAEADYLTEVASHPNQLGMAAFLYLVAAGTSVGIAVALYPILHRQHPAAALGSVVFRTIEAVMYTIGVVCLLSVLPLAQQLATAPATDAGTILALATTLLSVHDQSALTGVFAFCVGSLMYSIAFYRSRLIPRWLSGSGVVAAAFMFTACVLSLFSNNPITGYLVLIAPIFLQELVLAAWLLFKGFNPSTEPPGLEFASGGPGAETQPDPSRAPSH